ncbi:hypothetical protein [Cupriavidus necator]|uniref:hypothetical protein n=1 Tax=Cupriavidus necator TaxID=106590 RepID=UPI0005B4EA92|nr:hypothetical protein [Cupriavidus necator]
MSILTNLVSAQIRDARAEMDGKILTRPALLVTDGLNTIYAVDVDIGEKDPLRNVPIARGNDELLYADTGNACRLRRSATGQYEVVGFSKELPGTYTVVNVNLADLSVGSIVDLTIDGRPLSYGELATYGGYGVVPYGSSAIFRGGVLQEIR